MIGNLVDVLLMSKRSIGGIIPNVVIEEQHTDSLTITQHPVQQGAAIVDHAYKNPSDLVMKCGWSNSSTLINELFNGTLFSSPISDVSDLYKKLLDLQASRQLLDVVTGKRTYNNMLIKSLATTTNQETEYAMIITITFQQLIIVQIQNSTAEASNPQSTAPLEVPANEQESPESTASPQNLGVKQAITAPQQSQVSDAADLMEIG